MLSLPLILFLSFKNNPAKHYHPLHNFNSTYFFLGRVALYLCIFYIIRTIFNGKGEVNCLNLLITALRQDNLYTEMTLEFENGHNYNFCGRGRITANKGGWIGTVTKQDAYLQQNTYRVQKRLPAFGKLTYAYQSQKRLRAYQIPRGHRP